MHVVGGFIFVMHAVGWFCLMRDAADGAFEFGIDMAKQLTPRFED